MAEHRPEQELEHDEPAHAFDTHEPNYRLLWILSGVFVVLFFVMTFGVWQYYVIFTENRVQKVVLEPPSQELQAVRDREDRELHTYGIADKATGSVRIPIDRAMELLVSEARENRLKYSTAPYSVKSAAQAATAPPSQPGGGANQGPAGSGPATPETAGASMGTTGTAVGAPSNQK